LSTQVTNEDGTAADLVQHLSGEHKKGTRGLTEEYLASLHRTLHQRRRDPQPAHSHPEDEQDELVAV
jgi:hypothetical protein